LRAALSVTVALVALMLCTTLVVSEVSAAPVGTVGAAVAPPQRVPPGVNALLSFLAGLVAHVIHGNAELLKIFATFLR